MLLKLPKDVVTRQTKTRVAEERKAPSKRASKVVETDQELSLRIFELFSRYEHKLITTERELIDFLSISNEFGLDTETSGLSFYNDTIAGFSVGTEHISAYIPLNHAVGQNYTGSRSNLFNILSRVKLYGFNWKFDKHFMTKVDSRFGDLLPEGDGYLMARLLDNRLDAGLKPLYKRFIDPTVEDYSFSSLFKRSFTTYDPVLVYPYAAVDAQKHIILAKYLDNELRKTPQVYRLYRNLELPITEVIGRMERHGIQLDVDRIQSLNAELTEEAVAYLAQIKEITNPDFNPGSPKQVGDMMVELGLLERDSKGKVSTGVEVLETIAPLHPLPKLILDYRGVQKLGSTYTLGLLDYADEDGVAHPVFNQVGTDSGRMSSTRFNAQNIPKDNRFRNLFIPKQGNRLISVDYSQQEVRILASLAGDEAMMEAFRSGKDFYAVMASLAFNLPYDSCTKKGEHAEYRGHMKSVVLGLNYDMGMKSLAQNLGKSIQEATEIYQRFQQTCPKVDDFKKKCRELAFSRGYAETILKRRRYFEGIGYKALGLPRFESSDENVLTMLNKISHDRFAVKRLIEDAKKEGIYVKDREALAFMEERQCTNSVIQGSAADETKLAMVAFDKDKRARELDAHIVLQIHDEIIIECPAENAQEAGDLLAGIMNGVSQELLGIDGGAVPDVMSRWEKS